MRHLKALIEETIDPFRRFPGRGSRFRASSTISSVRAPAVTIEDAYRRHLRDMRQRDRAAGRTLMGPQATEFSVEHGPKGIPAALGSTGEQKALVIGLVIAHASSSGGCAERRR